MLSAEPIPIYEYACKKGGHGVELMQKIDDPPPRKCEQCGCKMARVISQTSFQLKGGGWYKDLYSSSGGSKSEAKTDKSEKKAEAKAEKKETPVKPAKPAEKKG